MASSPLKELMEVEVVGSIMLNCMDIICQAKNAKKKKKSNGVCSSTIVDMRSLPYNLFIIRLQTTFSKHLFFTTTKTY